MASLSLSIAYQYKQQRKCGMSCFDGGGTVDYKGRQDPKVETSPGLPFDLVMAESRVAFDLVFRLCCGSVGVL